MWTKDYPKVNGFYWFRGKIESWLPGKFGNTPPIIVRIDTDFEDESRAYFTGTASSILFSAMVGEWEKLIEPPKETDSPPESHDFNRNLRKVVETDNFGGDYPDEKFLNTPLCNEEKAISIANAMNELFCGPGASRYWKVVPYNHVLQPGFEP